jgi:hypothetical protein
MKTSISRSTRTRIELGLTIGFVLALFVQFAAPALSQDRAAAGVGSATLSKLFPGLADLSETTTLAVAVGWLGLSLLSPVSGDYSLELRKDQFEGEGRFKVATASATRAIIIPRDVVRAFLAAAGKVEVVEKKYQPRITHTDDYPSLSVSVLTKQGPLTIRTNSQPQWSKSGTYLDRTPWAIDYLGRTFVVIANDLDQALEPFEPYLQHESVFEELTNEIRLRKRPQR